MTGSKLKRIAKAISAWAGSELLAAGTWLGTLPDGPVTARSWAMLGVALVGPLLVGGAVYQTKNAAPA